MTVAGARRELAGGITDAFGRLWVVHGKPVPPMAASVVVHAPLRSSARVLAMTPTHLVIECSWPHAAGGWSPMPAGSPVEFEWWAFTAAEMGVGRAGGPVEHRHDWTPPSRPEAGLRVALVKCRGCGEVRPLLDERAANPLLAGMGDRMDNSAG